MPTYRLERSALLLILLTYFGLAILYAVYTPAWQVPDEPAHFNYVAQVAANGCCPVIERGDWDSDYLAQLTSSGFDPQYVADLDTVQYEDHQPPLYYLLAAPVYKLADGDVGADAGATRESPLRALRLFSATLGLGVIVCIYGVARLASGNGIIALSAAAFAAFLPQHIAILSGVGNDSLAELVVGAGLWLTMWYVMRARHAVPQRIPPEIILGLVMGIGFLTKLSTLLLGPAIMLAILLRWWRDADRPIDIRRFFDIRATSQSPLRAWLLFLIPAVVIGAVWWLRNLGVYGWPDFLGLGAHDAVVVGQLRTADHIAAIGFGPYLGDGIRITFQSFWGQFGWMGVVMPGWVYLALLAFTGVAYAGLAPLIIRARREGLDSRRWDIRRRDALLVLGAIYVLGILAFLYYNTSFVQFQGRYLYPALAAYALVMAGGLHGWVTLAVRRGESRSPAKWLPVLVMFGLAGLSAFALWRFIIPALPAW